MHLLTRVNHKATSTLEQKRAWGRLRRGMHSNADINRGEENCLCLVWGRTNAIRLESVFQRESFTGSANDNILPRITIKAYVRICLASACFVCVCMQIWMHLKMLFAVTKMQKRQRWAIKVELDQLSSVFSQAFKLPHFSH